MPDRFLTTDPLPVQLGLDGHFLAFRDDGVVASMSVDRLYRWDEVRRVTAALPSHGRIVWALLKVFELVTPNWGWVETYRGYAWLDVVGLPQPIEIDFPRPWRGARRESQTLMSVLDALSTFGACPTLCDAQAIDELLRRARPCVRRSDELTDRLVRDATRDFLRERGFDPKQVEPADPLDWA